MELEEEISNLKTDLQKKQEENDEQNKKILALYAQVDQLSKNSAKDAILDVKDVKALLGPDFLDKIEDISGHKQYKELMIKHNELLTESNMLKRANKELNDENE